MNLLIRSCLEIAFFSTIGEAKIEMDKNTEDIFVKMFESFNRLMLAFDRLKVYKDLQEKEGSITNTYQAIEKELGEIWTLTNTSLDIILEFDIPLVYDNMLIEIVMEIQEVITSVEKSLIGAKINKGS